MVNPLALSKMKEASSRIWTEFISFNDNHYTSTKEKFSSIITSCALNKEKCPHPNAFIKLHLSFVAITLTSPLTRSSSMC